MYSKNELRKISLEIRNSLDIDLISSKIVDKILSWDIFKFSTNIMIFYPINSEVNLLPLLTIEYKNYYFPKIIGNDIVPVSWDPKSGFRKGKYNIWEPQGTLLDDLSTLDLIFIPALAANLTGYRLGYGKGYYDRMLKLFVKSDTKTCIPISKSLLFDNLPVEPHDEKSDYIITENGIFTLNNLGVLNP